MPHQTILYAIQTVKDFISEPLFPDLIPDVFHRVELETIRRKGFELHILRHYKAVGPMPRRTVYTMSIQNSTFSFIPSPPLRGRGLGEGGNSPLIALV